MLFQNFEKNPYPAIAAVFVEPEFDAEEVGAGVLDVTTTVTTLCPAPFVVIILVKNCVVAPPDPSVVVMLATELEETAETVEDD